MGGASRRKGYENEHRIEVWFGTRGRPHIERRQSGSDGDRGDFTGWPGVVIEAKDDKSFNFSGWIQQLENEITEAQADTGVVVVKRPRITDPGQFYAVMTLERWEQLMTEAGR